MNQSMTRKTKSHETMRTGLVRLERNNGVKKTEAHVKQTVNMTAMCCQSLCEKVVDISILSEGAIITEIIYNT